MGTRVFVGGLTYRVRERDLEKFFRKYGRIKEVAMKNGFAFVEFDDYRDADDAVYELNGKELLGERVVVEHARGNSSRRGYGGRDDYSRRRSNDMDVRIQDRYGPPTRTDYRLVVENLSSRVSWQDLKDYMRQAGEVTYADAHKQRRNEGVVEFATSSDMRNAIDKLDDTDLSGRRIHLIEDNRRSGGGGGGGRRRSRSSSSRSRSRSRRKTRSRTRSRSSRSRSRSRSKSRARTKSKSRSRSKSRHAASRSKSKSRGATKSRSRSRSRSASKSKTNGVPAKEHTSRSRSVSKGPSKSKSKSRSVSKSPPNKDEDDAKDSPMRDDDDNKDD